MINEQTTKRIDVIKTMDEKDKLRLAICLADSNMSSISYDKKEILKFVNCIEKIKRLLYNTNKSS